MPPTGTERRTATYHPVPIHQGIRRVVPEDPLLTQAWTENEELKRRTTAANEEDKSLLSPANISKKNLQTGLLLGVWSNKTQDKGPRTPNNKNKTKFQKRKERLIATLKPPYFMSSIIFIMVIIYSCGTSELRSLLEWNPATWLRQPWRVITYGCAHASSAHLALNAIVALAVGWQLEREQCWWRVAAVWGGGAAGGALGAGALQPRVHVVGASAAVYAVLTAHVPHVALRFGHIPLWWFRPLSVLVLGMSEVCWTLLQQGGARADGSHVAWSAHALGALVGLPLAFIIFTGENSSKVYISVCRMCSSVLLAVLTISAIHYYTYSNFYVDS